ncbi:hypothetical protein [Sphingobium sp. B11D3A]|uniref:hypothetical protein n=2 Tax=unclassified Sphingobium TaxID=2611147 RepID=UPI0022252E73|nr:hypothetical protein [Sphingobium sp. B11D3A]
MQSRRDMLQASVGLAGVAVWAGGAPASAASAPAPTGAAPFASPLQKQLREDMETYASFGSKVSGSAGDLATAAWIGKRLATVGFKVDEVKFPIPTFEPAVTELRAGDKRVAVAAQPVVVSTPAKGITAPAVLVRDAFEAQGVAGKIAIVVLPYGRHAAIFSGEVKPMLDRVIPNKPAAIVIVTTGPTGSIVALNTRLKPIADVPIALMAPRDLPIIAEAVAARRPLTLILTGKSATGHSSNIIARREAGPKWLAFSTPRSGWGVSVGERAPGTAAFLELCRWAAIRYPDHSLFAINAGGHELDFAGTHHSLSEGPPAAQTQIWTHLGAGLATRDAYEVLSRNHQLLSCADPQRVLMTSPGLMAETTEAFRGLVGYERPIEVVGGAGELSSIIDRGYVNAFAGLGIHRWCHVEDDTIDKVDAALLEPVVEAHRAVVEAAVARAVRA